MRMRKGRRTNTAIPKFSHSKIHHFMPNWKINGIRREPWLSATLIKDCSVSGRDDLHDEKVDNGNSKRRLKTKQKEENNDNVWAHFNHEYQENGYVEEETTKDHPLATPQVSGECQRNRKQSGWSHSLVWIAL